MGRFKDEGNILVMNQSKNVLVNYNFMLRVEGIYDLPCKSVHSFTKENEFEYVQEGGLNDYVHALRKPVSKPFSFTVERYVGMDIISPLPLGAELILPVILMIAPNADKFANAKRTFVFTGCTVISKTFGELNAEKSELLTETIVIGYREMVEVTVPVHVGDAGDLWEFDGQKVNGNSRRSARTLPSDVLAKIRRMLPTEDGEGTVVKSAKTSRDTGKPVVRQWLPTEDGEGTRVKSAKTFRDTGKPVVRQWLPAEDGEKTVVKSAKTSRDTGKPKARTWPPTQSAKTIPEAGEPLVRTWPPTQSAKK